MSYIDVVTLKKYINQRNDYQNMVEKMKESIRSFADTFNDHTNDLSAWGHHYFCEIDGGRLIFDREDRHSHQCEICGKTYDTPLLTEVWTYIYRNEAVMTMWQAAVLYRLTEDKNYLEDLHKIGLFYAKNYTDFPIHDKIGNIYADYDSMAWGCGRIMPQGLNESIFIIKMLNALELIKEEINENQYAVYQQLFESVFALIKPQPLKQGVHNIACWNNASIGMMGLFLGNQEMIDYAFKGPYNIHRQLEEGVTEDGFWYEGSIHYNFFTLEGVTSLLFFADLYGYDSGTMKDVVEKMLLAAYDYAFDNHQLPNPNDGWPNINLKTYSYIYAWVYKIYGPRSLVAKRLEWILAYPSDRGVLPLSKPYYFDNRISLNQLLIGPELTQACEGAKNGTSKVFNSSCFAVLKNQTGVNVFLKYGHNGPSHAHPDKMNIEVIFGKDCLTRDLSNSGYGNALCNEWHKMSISHNTVVVGGKNHVSTERGTCLEFSDEHILTEAKNVYEGIDYRREITLRSKGFTDIFEVESEVMNHYDYFFHTKAQLLTELKLRPASLAYDHDGYQHIKEIKQVDTFAESIELTFQLNLQIITCQIDLKGKTLYIAKTMDNPVNKNRTTLIISTDGTGVTYKLDWNIKEDYDE